MPNPLRHRILGAADLRSRMTWAFRLGFPLTIPELCRMLSTRQSLVRHMVYELARDDVIWRVGWHRRRMGGLTRLYALSPSETIPAAERLGDRTCG